MEKSIVDMDTKPLLASLITNSPFFLVGMIVIIVLYVSELQLR